MSYLNDSLYKDAILYSDKKEYVKSMDFWVPLMNKYITSLSQDKSDNELFKGTLMVEFLQSLLGYCMEINRDNIFAEDSDEGDEGESDGEMDEEEEENDEENTIQNTKFFQFGLKEEDDIEMDDDNEESDLGGITNFQDLLTGGRKAFHSMTDFILSIINKFDDNKCQNSIYIILADCFKELDNIKDSINYYNMALDNTSDTDFNGKICILLRITELIKWSDNALSSPKYLSIYKKRLEEAIRLVKISNDKEYSPILQELEEEMNELKTQQSQDIRSLHPEFDSVLKRALGQISTDSIQDTNVNDLSSLIQKKKPKKK
ncbi:hypothetical protein MOSE0_A04830 [Monosporozyma servazzii]